MCRSKEFVAHRLLHDLEKEDQRNFVRGLEVFNISWWNKVILKVKGCSGTEKWGGGGLMHLEWKKMHHVKSFFGDLLSTPLCSCTPERRPVKNKTPGGQAPVQHGHPPSLSLSFSLSAHKQLRNDYFMMWPFYEMFCTLNSILTVEKKEKKAQHAPHCPASAHASSALVKIIA